MSKSITEIVDELESAANVPCICIENPKTEEDWVLCRSCQIGTVLNEAYSIIRESHKAIFGLKVNA